MELAASGEPGARHIAECVDYDKATTDAPTWLAYRFAGQDFFDWVERFFLAPRSNGIDDQRSGIR